MQRKDYSDSDDFRSIHCLAAGSKWNDFIKGILDSVRNAKKGGGNPFAQLNADGAISFFLHKCDKANCAECVETSKFTQKLNADYIIDQLDFYRGKSGFQVINNEEQLLKIIPHPDTNLTEYQFNITAENLDSLLRLNHNYAGYRNQISLINLYKQFSIKPGFIYAFPVYPITEQELLVRATGCQLSEMLSVQLLHLLPDYDDKGLDKPFHWQPDEVEDNLLLLRVSILGILNDILLKQKMLTAENLLNFDDEHMLLSNPSSDQDVVRVADIDEKSKDFYLLYGNTAAEELQNCKSLEIKTMVVFDHIKKHIEACLKYYENDDPESKDAKDSRNAKKVIDQMISIERERLSKTGTLTQESFISMLLSPFKFFMSPDKAGSQKEKKIEDKTLDEKAQESKKK